MGNHRVRMKSLYVSLVLAVIHRWQGRLPLPSARYHGALESLLHDSPVGDLLWPSGTLAVACLDASQCHRQHRYLPMLRFAHRLLQSYPDVMVLADRGFANHALLAWLSQSN
jgi:hypothetical protein